MSNLDWKTYREAYNEIHDELFKLSMKMNKLTKLQKENHLVNLEQIEADEKVKNDLVEDTKKIINRVLDDGE